LVGAVLGVIVGLPLARPAIWFARQAKGTLDATSGRALFGVGVWLFVPVGISALIALLAAAAAREASAATLACLAVTPCVAAFGAILGARLAWRRSRWIATIRRGEDPRFRVRPAEAADAALPSLDAAKQQEADVLEEILVSGEADPYRATELVEPVALMGKSTRG
jgi:hypothetical protein